MWQQRGECDIRYQPHMLQYFAANELLRKEVRNEEDCNVHHGNAW